MRSNVVNRALHRSHSRRRRMAAPSSTRRESTTRSSDAAHIGHFMARNGTPDPGESVGYSTQQPDSPTQGNRDPCPGHSRSAAASDANSAGMVTTSPVRSTSLPLTAMSWSTRSRVSTSSPRPDAMDHSDSPGRTTCSTPASGSEDAAAPVAATPITAATQSPKATIHRSNTWGRANELLPSRGVDRSPRLAEPLIWVRPAACGRAEPDRSRTGRVGPATAAAGR